MYGRSSHAIRTRQFVHAILRISTADGATVLLNGDVTADFGKDEKHRQLTLRDRSSP